MSILIDTITFIWAVGLLFGFAVWLVDRRGLISWLGFITCAMYLLAQSGWTTAYLLGDTWGRDLSNYMWFAFNSLVFTTLTVLWIRDKGQK